MADRIRNVALSDDVRTEVHVFNVPVPVEGQVIEIIPYAEAPYEIISVRRKCSGTGNGACGMVFEIDAADITDWSDADSTGEIVAVEGTLVTSFTDGSSDFIAEGGSFRVTLQNIESDTADLVFQVTLRRTEDNVVVSE